MAGGVLGILLLKIRNMLQIKALRERFAADLHDELGASLRSIGMLAEMAREERTSPKTLAHLLVQIQDTTASTLAATRYRIEKQTHPFKQNLSGEMRRFSQRILADITWNLEIHGEEHLRNLKPTLADDLMLFYKECLVNISRHSKATEVKAILHATPKHVRLDVADNGEGLTSPPPSLQRRARLMGGKLATSSRDPRGTNITLTFRPKK